MSLRFHANLFLPPTRQSTADPRHRCPVCHLLYAEHSSRGCNGGRVTIVDPDPRLNPQLLHRLDLATGQVEPIARFW